MSENLKWYRNKDMLKEILDQNQKELLKIENEHKRNYLKDNINLLQDHLVLLEEKEKLEKIKTNIENKISAMKHIIEVHEINGNDIAVHRLRCDIRLLKEVLE